MNREGNVTEIAAREIVTAPSSSGWPCNTLPIDMFAGELLSDEMNVSRQIGSGSMAAYQMEGPRPRFVT